MTNRLWVGIAILAGASVISGTSAFAQTQAAATSLDAEVDLFRKDIRSTKKQIIAANLVLTDTEAQQFWPIYDRYTVELSAINDQKYALLKEYAQNYTTMTNEQSESYIKGRAAIEQSIMELRLKYFPVFRKVLSGKVTALLYQMDWRLSLIVELQLASQIPLIQP